MYVYTYTCDMYTYYMYVTQESACDVLQVVLNNNTKQTILEMKDTDVLRIFCVFRNTIKQIQNVLLHRKKVCCIMKAWNVLYD